MKTIGYCSTFFVVMLILFHPAGCGRGKDEPKEAVQEAAEPQNVSGPEAPQAAKRVS